jgi:hypothetical protein
MTHVRFAALAVYIVSVRMVLNSESVFVPLYLRGDTSGARSAQSRPARTDAGFYVSDGPEATDDRFKDGWREELPRGYSKTPEPTATPCVDCMQPPNPTPPDSSEPRPKPKPTPTPEAYAG